jgi:hypothetical protein
MSIKPITDVTLVNGKTKRLTKKFKYEKTTPEREIIFHPQLVTASTLWKIG